MTEFVTLESSGMVLNTSAIDYGLDCPGSIPGIGGVEIFSLLLVQTDPGVHSASYKMSIGAFPGVKAAERRTSHHSSS